MELRLSIEFAHQNVDNLVVPLIHWSFQQREWANSLCYYSKKTLDFRWKCSGRALQYFAQVYVQEPLFIIVTRKKIERDTCIRVISQRHVGDYGSSLASKWDAKILQILHRCHIWDVVHDWFKKIAEALLCYLLTQEFWQANFWQLNLPKHGRRFACRLWRTDSVLRYSVMRAFVSRYLILPCARICPW